MLAYEPLGEPLIDLGSFLQFLLQDLVIKNIRGRFCFLARNAWLDAECAPGVRSSFLSEGAAKKRLDAKHFKIIPGNQIAIRSFRARDRKH